MKTLTTIYSDSCVEALENLFSCLGETFTCIRETLGLSELHLSDLFCYGVFCRPETYANYYVSADYIPSYIEFPSILTSPCSTADERLDYVKKLIDTILCGEEEENVVEATYDSCTGEKITDGHIEYAKQEKPEWMVWVEEDADENICGNSPSTFLYLKAKSEEYGELGEKFLNFLYSPSKVITMLES